MTPYANEGHSLLIYGNVLEISLSVIFFFHVKRMDNTLAHNLSKVRLREGQMYENWESLLESVCNPDYIMF